jgi:adenosylcobyric acid synthase
VGTCFAGGKVLDRPSGRAQEGPGAGHEVAGYRVHHGRVVARPGASPWLVADDSTPLGWHDGRFAGTTLHGLFEADPFRWDVLRWAARVSGVDEPAGLGATSFVALRRARLDRIADALEAHADLDRLFGLIETGAAAG